MGEWETSGRFYPIRKSFTEMDLLIEATVQEYRTYPRAERYRAEEEAHGPGDRTNHSGCISDLQIRTDYP